MLHPKRAGYNITKGNGFDLIGLAGQCRRWGVM